MIKISPEEVRALASQYRNQATNVEEINRTMDSLLAQLHSVWEGSACEAYNAKFEELKPGFEKVVNLIEEIATGLDVSAQNFEETDRGVAGQWG